MLEIIVGSTEMFDEEAQEFVGQGGEIIQLEHSLVSLSKWESKFEKPFLGAKAKTQEELLFYIECMLMSEKPPREILLKLSQKNFEEINEYLNAKMTATWFSDTPGAPQTSEVITAELIYYWMTVFQIDFECQNWHLNRLFTLIRICNIKQAKPKPMSRAERVQRQRELNAQRREQMGTKG